MEPLPIRLHRPLNPNLGRLCSSFRFGRLTHSTLACAGLFYLADVVMLPVLSDRNKNWSQDVQFDVKDVLSSLGTGLGALPAVPALSQRFFDRDGLPTDLMAKIAKAFAKANRREGKQTACSPTALAVAIHPSLGLTAAEALVVKQHLAPLGLTRPLTLGQIFCYVP